MAVIEVHLIMAEIAVFLAIVIRFFFRRKRKSKKRKFGDAFDDERFLDMMKKNFDMFTQRLGEVAKRTRIYKSDRSEKIGALVGELRKLPGLEGKQKIKVARRIIDKDSDLDLFLDVPEETRALMVQMILDGEY